MTLSEQSRQDLQWLLDNLKDASAPVMQSKPDFTIYTDASNAGWGCYDPQQQVKSGGQWSTEEKNCHINYLELKGVFFGLKCLCTDNRISHVRIMTDNTTAVACINKQGSTKSKMCNEISREIWLFAMQQNMWLSAAHCPGVENTEADEASRVFDDQTEWAIKHDLYKKICAKLGEPEIDLFASRLNKKVHRYCSWQLDPEATFVDSFLYDWGQELVYAFPPFSVIHKVIQKFIQNEAQGILIVPLWKTQPWLTLLVEIMCKEPVVFEINNDELYLPFREGRHPLAWRLRMLAVYCSGSPCATKDFERKLSGRSCAVGGTQPCACTDHTCNGGEGIASPVGWIPLNPL